MSLPSADCLTLPEIRVEVDRCLALTSSSEYSGRVVLKIGEITAKAVGSLGVMEFRRGALGHAVYLTFNSEVWELLPPEERMETVRHEVAHAIDYFRRGDSDHGPLWQEIAIVIGAAPIPAAANLSPEVSVILRRQKAMMIAAEINESLRRDNLTDFRVALEKMLAAYGIR